MHLTIDLSPPTVAFSTLEEGQLFVWNGALWMVYPHMKQYGSKEAVNCQAVLISNQTGGGYRHQMFEPQHHVTPCVVDMKVSRIG